MANKIDLIRLKKRLSYEKIAKKCDLTAPYIQMLAKGKRENPSLKVMEKIAEALDEKTEYVFQITKRGRQTRHKNQE